MLIAMAGLPGTGKSTLAARLALELGGIVLSKDQVRASLFPAQVLDYSATENHISMAAIFQAAQYIHTMFPQRAVIIDGRTFLGPKQVDDLFALAARLRTPPRIIECVCTDEVARQRLEYDRASRTHPAQNRDFALYQAVQAQAKPIQVPRLILDTGAVPLEECVRRSLDYLNGSCD